MKTKSSARVLRQGRLMWTLSEDQQSALLHGLLAGASKRKDSALILNGVAGSIAEAADCDVVAIEWLLQDSDEIEYIGLYASPKLKRGAGCIPVHQSPTKPLYNTGKPLAKKSLGKRQRFAVAFTNAIPVGILLAVPIKVAGIVVGAMTLVSGSTRKLDAAFARRLEPVAALVGTIAASGRLAQTERQVEEFRQHFLEGSFEGLVILDPAGNTILDINHRALALSGQAREALLGRSVLALHTADDADEVLALLKNLRKNGVPATIRSSHILREGGKALPVEITARLAKLSVGPRIIYSLRDITQERKAEVQLSASEELLTLIVEGTPDVFFYVHNTKGIFTYVSPSVERVTGHPIRAWKDHYAKFVTDNPINDKLREYTERAITKGESPPVYLGEVYHANGRRMLLEIHEKPVFKEGRVIGVQGVARDITEQQRWQQTLVESEKKYRMLFNSVRDGIFQSDADGLITDINLAGAGILGYRIPEEVLAHGLRWSDLFVNEEERHKVIKMVRESGFVKVMEFFARRKDGEVIFMEGSATGLFDREGRIHGYDGTFRDISERKRLEEQLIQSQKMESIGLLAGGIAHDFNNILGGILGYASYLKSVVPADDKIHPHLTTIERSALRAAELTSKLLAFARGGKYVVRPININSVIDETLRLLRGSFDKSVTIEEELAPDLPAIEADAGQMQQVLMNLCVNARDAMPGGGRLVIGSERVPHTEAFLASQPTVKTTPYVRVSVSDTGTGIEKGNLNRIFDPFFSTKEKGKGTGLGLATVYGIVKNHAGLIEVRSVVGMGSTFILYFPSVEEAAVHVEERVVVAEGGTETILIVDDEETIRALARDILTGRGYTVLEAASGAEAVELFKQRNDIALVILDMVMPEMSGKEAFARMQTIQPDVRAILSTGYAEDERTRELLTMGLKALVQKPYRAPELASKVRSVLDQN